MLGIHLLDTVVHTWDVAVSLGHDHRPADSLIGLVAAQAARVPAGAGRERPGAAFAPILESPVGDPWATTLAQLGRPIGWTPPTSLETRHLGVRIERPAAEVYAYAVEPTNLPDWASGLGSSVEWVDGRWVVDSPLGRVSFVFVPRNEFGVLDHQVTLPSGQVVDNPLRVLGDGPACDVVFTLRRRPEVSRDDFARDVEAVSADLESLKRRVEGLHGQG